MIVGLIKSLNLRSRPSFLQTGKSFNFDEFPDSNVSCSKFALVTLSLQKPYSSTFDFGLVYVILQAIANDFLGRLNIYFRGADQAGLLNSWSPHTDLNVGHDGVLYQTNRSMRSD